MKNRIKKLKLRQLDAWLARWRLAELPVRPPSAWEKAVCESFVMSAAYLAKTQGVVPSTVLRLKTSEADDTMTLEALAAPPETVEVQVQKMADSLLKGSLRELWR